MTVYHCAKPYLPQRWLPERFVSLSTSKSRRNSAQLTLCMDVSCVGSIPGRPIDRCSSYVFNVMPLCGIFLIKDLIPVNVADGILGSSSPELNRRTRGVLLNRSFHCGDALVGSDGLEANRDRNADIETTITAISASI